MNIILATHLTFTVCSSTTIISPPNKKFIGRNRLMSITLIIISLNLFVSKIPRRNGISYDQMSLPGPKNHHFLTFHFPTKTFTTYYELHTKSWRPDIPPINPTTPPLAKDFPAQCHADFKLDPAWSHDVPLRRDFPAQCHAEFKLDPAWSHVALTATGTTARIYLAAPRASIYQMVIPTPGGRIRKKNTGPLHQEDDWNDRIDWNVTIDQMAGPTIGLYY